MMEITMESEDDIQPETPEETPAPKKKGRKKKAAAKKAESPPEREIPAAPATAAELLAMADKLTAEERRKLKVFGAILPEGLQESSITGRPTWGYWCSHCNGLAMHFPGSRWEDSPEPMGGMSLDSISWVQIRGQKSENPEVVTSPNRQSPLCPCCGASVRLGPNRTLHPDHIVRVTKHEKSIDEHYNYQHKLALKKELDKKNADIGDAAQNDIIPGEKALTASQRMTPQQRADVEYAASKIDFGDGL